MPERQSPTEHDPSTNLSPLEALNAFIDENREAYTQERLVELEGLKAQFEAALEIAADIDSINGAITESSRPDLTMQEKATMMQVDDPREFRDITKEMAETGVITFRKTNNFLYGIRNLAQIENLKEWLEVNAAEGFEGFRQSAKKNNLADETARYLLMYTHLPKEAFGRMHAIAPDLTMNIVSLCANSPGKQDQTDNIMPELFMAYTLMSMLVDTGDLYVVRDEPGFDGKTPDHLYLCR